MKIPVTKQISSRQYLSQKYWDSGVKEERLPQAYERKRHSELVVPEHVTHLISSWIIWDHTIADLWRKINS
jgi:hypothetical protein